MPSKFAVNRKLVGIDIQVFVAPLYIFGEPCNDLTEGEIDIDCFHPGDIRRRSWVAKRSGVLGRSDIRQGLNDFGKRHCPSRCRLSALGTHQFIIQKMISVLSPPAALARATFPFMERISLPATMQATASKPRVLPNQAFPFDHIELGSLIVSL